MKKMIGILFVFVLTVVLVACGGGNEVAAPEELHEEGVTPLEELYVELAVESAVHPDGLGVDFVITTNLPDGTDLITALSREGESEGQGGNVIIRNGTGTSRKSLPAGGNYIFEVLMSPLLQNEAVRERIGRMGEVLAGPLLATWETGAIHAEFEVYFENQHIDSQPGPETPTDIPRWAERYEVEDGLVSIDLQIREAHSVPAFLRGMYNDIRRAVEHIVQNYPDYGAWINVYDGDLLVFMAMFTAEDFQNLDIRYLQAFPERVGEFATIFDVNPIYVP